MKSFKNDIEHETTYLPTEKNTFLEMVIYSIQHVLVLLPATILVALLTGYPVSTVFVLCGITNIVFILLTKKQVPLFWGASFAYIPSIASITCAEYGIVSSNNLLAIASLGVIFSGIAAIIIGVLFKLIGTQNVNKLLPATITGSIAIVIGISLSKTAMQNIFSSQNEVNNNIAFIISFLTLCCCVILNVCFKKSKLKKVSIIISILFGCTIAGVFRVLGYNVFDITYNFNGELFSLPRFIMPWEAKGELVLQSILSIFPVALITIPETIAHVSQADLYVNELSLTKFNKSTNLKKYMSNSIIIDGIMDIICGLFGGVGTTSYGENLSVMSINKNYSTTLIFVSSLIMIFMSFFTPIIFLIYSIPKCVMAGISIYLFGMIVCQGLELIKKNVDFSQLQNLSIIAIVIIVGVGGIFGFDNGMIPLFGLNIPAIALSAILGILINVILTTVNKFLKE